MEVKSGVDWFELDGSAVFGDAKVSLPELLRAIKQGESMVKLDDGTFGIVPEEWMKKYRSSRRARRLSKEKHLRFTRPQAGLLDALLAGEPDVAVDAIFARVRQELADFAGIEAAEPTPHFAGELRDYQRDGLGLAVFPPALRLRWLPGRRHGLGQNHPGAGAARSRAASAVRAPAKM